jgi:hypothetical protein
MVNDSASMNGAEKMVADSPETTPPRPGVKSFLVKDIMRQPKILYPFMPHPFDNFKGQTKIVFIENLKRKDRRRRPAQLEVAEKKGEV